MSSLAAEKTRRLRFLQSILSNPAPGKYRLIPELVHIIHEFLPFPDDLVPEKDLFPHCFHFLFFGNRNTGKTTLMLDLLKQLRQHYAQVYYLTSDSEAKNENHPKTAPYKTQHVQVIVWPNDGKEENILRPLFQPHLGRTLFIMEEKSYNSGIGAICLRRLLLEGRFLNASLWIKTQNPGAMPRCWRKYFDAIFAFNTYGKMMLTDFFGDMKDQLFQDLCEAVWSTEYNALVCLRCPKQQDTSTPTSLCAMTWSQHIKQYKVNLIQRESSMSRSCDVLAEHLSRRQDE